MKGKKNNIATLGYFLKRLRDSDFVVLKMFEEYSESDPRKWTVLVDPENSALFITCYVNQNFRGECFFEMNDGGKRFTKNYNLKTKSMEVMIMSLLEHGVQQKTKDCVFEKKE